MNKYLNHVYRFFLIISSCVMLWALFVTIFFPRVGEIFSLFRDVDSHESVSLNNIVCLFIAMIIFLMTTYYWRKRAKNKVLSNKFTYVFLIVELIMYVITLLLFIKFIDFNQPVDDTAITLKFLDQLNHGEKWGYNYMYSNPQNLLLMFIFSAIQSIFGMKYQAIIIIFCLLHIGTIVLTFLSLKNLKLSNMASLLSIQVLIFAVQITLHVPVAYTDILSVFFMAVTLFFFTYYLRTEDEKKEKFQYFYIALASIFSVISFISKGTMLIVVIALFLFLIFSGQGKKKLICLMPLLFLFIGNFLWGQFINSQNLFPDKNYGQPNTHYIMMGLNNTPIPEELSEDDQYKWMVGAYSSEDQKFTWNLFLEKKISKEKIQKEHIKVIKERLQKMSLSQLVAAINNKVAVTWSSGDLKSSFEIFLGTGRNEDKMWVFKNNFSGLIIYSIMMVIQYLIYLGIIFSAIKYFKAVNPWIFFSSIYITGYFVFLLLWEASPRYAMGIFVPAVLSIGLLFRKSEVTRRKH